MGSIAYPVGFYSDAAPALSWHEVVVKFEAQSDGTEWEKKPAWAIVDDRFFVLAGTGSADLSAARAEELVRARPGEALDDGRTALKTGLQTYFTNVADVADGAAAYAFVMALGQCSDVASVELDWQTTAASGTNEARRLELSSQALVVHGEAAVNGSDQLLKDDGSTAIVPANDKLVVFAKYGIAFGLLSIGEADAAPASGNTVALRALFK